MQEPELQATGGISAAFRAVESGLKQYLLRFFLREQDIEDIVQETYLRARESEQVRTIKSPRSYLFRVARNIALTEITRKANHLTLYMGDLQQLDVIDNSPSLEDGLDTDRSVQDLCAVVESLPPQCRRVLVMRKVLGFSHKEIARRMNISTRTVEKHLTKGLQRCLESRAEQAPPAEISLAAGNSDE